MFTVEERERIRGELVAVARADPDITGAAHTGSFAPDDDYGPRGPGWWVEFGPTDAPSTAPAAAPDNLAGLCWHHVRHAIAAIDRDGLLEADWLVDQASIMVAVEALSRLA